MTAPRFGRVPVELPPIVTDDITDANVTLAKLSSGVQTSLGKADTAYQAPAVIAAGATQADARTAIGAVDAAAITTAVNNLIAGAPGALDTLNELAAALGNDANFAATVTAAIAAKYTKPGSGIPSTDMTSAVQTSLALAQTALQPIITPAPAPLPGWDDAPTAFVDMFDDFNGAAGSAPSSSMWLVDTVNQGGIQTYTTSSANVRLDGSSNLVIEAIQSGSPGSYTYTSGHVTTRTKWNFGYGKISARIKFPKGPGFNPAFWLLGQGQNPVAEIDMAEMYGPLNQSGGTQYHIALHDKISSLTGVNGTMPGVADLTDGYHEYWVIRSSDRMAIGIDDFTCAKFTQLDMPATSWELFQRPLYIILNLAVGDSWYGLPSGTTPWPAQILVDWVRYTPAITAIQSAAIFDSTTIGRGLVTTPDKAAARALTGSVGSAEIADAISAQVSALPYQGQFYQINAQTGTTYTLVLADAAKLLTLSNAAAITLTVPPNSSVAFSIGTRVDLSQIGVGQVTVSPGAGVTINATPGKKFSTQFSMASLIKTDTDTWLLTGSLAA